MTLPATGQKRKLRPRGEVPAQALRPSSNRAGAGTQVSYRPTALSSTLDSTVDTEGAANQFLGGAWTWGLLCLSLLCPHPDWPQAVALMHALA